MICPLHTQMENQMGGAAPRQQEREPKVREGETRCQGKNQDYEMRTKTVNCMRSQPIMTCKLEIDKVR